jgi:hypothetical protein
MAFAFTLSSSEITNMVKSTAIFVRGFMGLVGLVGVGVRIPGRSLLCGKLPAGPDE